MMLPNLSKLTCTPCGAPFDNYNEFLHDKKAARHKFFSKRDAFCGICWTNLDDKADVEEPENRTRDVEALIENDKCGHVFHKSCIVAWLSTAVDNDYARNCPMCMNPISREVLKRLRAEGSNDEEESSEYDDALAVSRTAEFAFGQEWLVVTLDNGSKEYYQLDDTDEEHLMFIIDDEGVKKTYSEDGTTAREEHPDGGIEHYQIVDGIEVIRHWQTPEGIINIYDGGPGMEHLVRSLLPDGTVITYDGPRDREIEVKRTQPSLLRTLLNFFRRGSN